MGINIKKRDKNDIRGYTLNAGQIVHPLHVDSEFWEDVKNSFEQEVLEVVDEYMMTVSKDSNINSFIHFQVDSARDIINSISITDGNVILGILGENNSQPSRSWVDDMSSLYSNYGFSIVRNYSNSLAIIMKKTR